MKYVLTAIAVVLASTQAHAISRYNSQSMSCAEAKAVVRNEGAVILRWRSTRNPTLPLYGRFVRNDGFCSASERAETSYIPTADNRSCAIDECKPYYPSDDDFMFRRN